MMIQDVKLKLATQDIKVEDKPLTRFFFTVWNVPYNFFIIVELRCISLRPEANTVMINKDGSLGDGFGGYGDTIRDTLGVCLCTVAGSDTSISVLGHELQGVVAGMKVVIFML